MNIIPVSNVGQGTETIFPSILDRVSTARYWGLVFTNWEMPAMMEPSPNDNKPNTGIANPPISNPIPFSVSLTATDLRPPTMA